MDIPFDVGWAWGLALIALTIAGHALAIVLLARIVQRAGRRGFYGRAFRHPIALPVALIGAVGFALTVLHGIEAGIWALAYVWLGALGTLRDALIFSISAITTRDASGLVLGPHWRMLAALEAGNGVLLFCISTAFVFAVIQEVLLIVDRFEQPDPAAWTPPRDWD